MINFYEKIIVLSRLDSGELPTVYLKNRNGKLEMNLELDDPFDYLIITNGTAVQRCETKFVLPNFEFDGVFACGVYRDNKLISFGACGKISKEKFSKLADRPTYDNLEYDDWQIATENYYLGSIYDKADDNAKTDFSTEKSQQSKSGGDSPDQNDESGYFTKKSQCDCCGSEAVEHSESPCSPERRYYDKVRGNLENILDSGKKYSALSSLIPFSRFVEITENNKRYYLGIQGKSPDYIIYATKGKESKPPDGFSNGFFLPGSLFLPTENGYFLLLVSCETGKTINS